MKHLWLLLLPGCIAFNDVCPADQSEVLGETQRSLDLRATTLRAHEAPVGNLLADAVLSETSGADLAIVPAAFIEQDTPCGQRDFLQRGLVRQNDVDALITSTDTIWLLTVTSEDLKRVFERSVSQLGATVADNPGFLQISGALFTADCAEAAQTVSSDGKSITFPGARVDVSTIYVKGSAVGPGDTFKLAVPASLASGKYAYVDLTRPGTLLVDTRKTVKQMLMDHLRKHSPVDPQVEGRILLKETCE